MRRKYSVLLLLLLLVLKVVHSQNEAQSIVKHLEELEAREELLAEDCSWKIIRSHTSSVTNVFHIYFVQTVNGFPVLGTESSIHIDKNLNKVQQNSNFIKNIQSKIKGSRQPAISALDAVNGTVRKLGYPISEPIRELESKADENLTLLSDGNYFEEEIRPALKWVITKDNKFVLVWDFMLLEKDYQHYWKIGVDASNGMILSKKDEIVYCGFSTLETDTNDGLNFNFNPYPPAIINAKPVNCSNCYEVFPQSFESPYEGDRIIIQNPADLMASPEGWHSGNGINSITSGNNADVYTRSGGYRGNGGVNSDFTGFAFGEDYSWDTPYKDAATTNVFYWINYMHDITYLYGFDEASGNFQKENFGDEGEGGDQMNAIIQRGQLCNATVIISSDDGNDPTINLYTCYQKDGSFDNTIILHEFGHAIIRRLGCGAFLGEEGWCDWFGALLTMKPSDDGTQPKAIGNYLFNYGVDGPGVRQFPYSTDFNINPDTYGDVENYPGRHNIGAVWGEIMWEFTWHLIDSYGYDPDYRNFTGVKGQDAGNIMAMAISIEALKLMPCPAGFADVRNALIKAAKLIYDAELECEIWEPFVKRGLGYSAEQGSIYKSTDQVEAFDYPPTTASFSQDDLELCYINEVYTKLGGGNPFGGVYSGPGVTDDGDGFTFTFNPLEAGPGVHTVTYTIEEETSCRTPSSDTIEITVTEDKEGPYFPCPEAILMEISDLTQPKVPNLIDDIELTDNCDAYYLTITQEPAPGTDIDVQNPPMITLLAKDWSGNETLCEVLISIDITIVNKTTDISLFPVPSKGIVNVKKASGDRFKSASVYSMTGELVKYYNLEQVDSETILTMENLRSGAYLIRFSLQSGDIIKYVLIE